MICASPRCINEVPPGRKYCCNACCNYTSCLRHKQKGKMPFPTPEERARRTVLVLL